MRLWKQCWLRCQSQALCEESTLQASKVLATTSLVMLAHAPRGCAFSVCQHQDKARWAGQGGSGASSGAGFALPRFLPRCAAPSLSFSLLTLRRTFCADRRIARRP